MYYVIFAFILFIIIIIINGPEDTGNNPEV